MPYNPFMQRMIGIERTINSILRVLIVSTMVIIAVSVMAVMFEFNDFMPGGLSKPQDSMSRVDTSTYQGDITWAIVHEQDSQNTSFTFVDNLSENSDSDKDDSEGITFSKVHSVAT